MILDWAMNSHIWHQKHNKQQKIDKLPFLKLNNYFYRKGSYQEDKKRQLPKGEKTFSNHMYDKDLVSRTFKNSHNSATKW